MSTPSSSPSIERTRTLPAAAQAQHHVDRARVLREGADLTLVITRKSGEVVKVPMTGRLDTAEEVSVYQAGGVLQRFAQDFLAANKAA